MKDFNKKKGGLNTKIGEDSKATKSKFEKNMVGDTNYQHLRRNKTKNPDWRERNPLSEKFIENKPNLENIGSGTGGTGTDDQVASEVPTNTTNFNDFFDNSLNNVQKVLDYLDDNLGSLESLWIKDTTGHTVKLKVNSNGANRTLEASFDDDNKIFLETEIGKVEIGGKKSLIHTINNSSATGFTYNGEIHKFDIFDTDNEYYLQFSDGNLKIDATDTPSFLHYLQQTAEFEISHSNNNKFKFNGTNSDLDIIDVNKKTELVWRGANGYLGSNLNGNQPQVHLDIHGKDWAGMQVIANGESGFDTSTIAVGNTSNKYGLYMENGTDDLRIYNYGENTYPFILTNEGRFGLNTLHPNSKLQVVGSIAKSVYELTYNTFVFNDTHYVVKINIQSDTALQMTLPDANVCKGREYIVIPHNIGFRNVIISNDIIYVDNKNSDKKYTFDIDTNRLVIKSDGVNWNISTSKKGLKKFHYGKIKYFQSEGYKTFKNSCERANRDFMNAQYDWEKYQDNCFMSIYNTDSEEYECENIKIKSELNFKTIIEKLQEFDGTKFTGNYVVEIHDIISKDIKTVNRVYGFNNLINSLYPYQSRTKSKAGTVVQATNTDLVDKLIEEIYKKFKSRANLTSVADMKSKGFEHCIWLNRRKSNFSGKYRTRAREQYYQNTNSAYTSDKKVWNTNSQDIETPEKGVTYNIGRTNDTIFLVYDSNYNGIGNHIFTADGSNVDDLKWLRELKFKGVSVIAVTYNEHNKGMGEHQYYFKVSPVDLDAFIIPYFDNSTLLVESVFNGKRYNFHNKNTRDVGNYIINRDKATDRILISNKLMIESFNSGTLDTSETVTRGISLKKQGDCKLRFRDVLSGFVSEMSRETIKSTRRHCPEGINLYMDNYKDTQNI